jgi:hypothetical protein
MTLSGSLRRISRLPRVGSIVCTTGGISLPKASLCCCSSNWTTAHSGRNPMVIFTPAALAVNRIGRRLSIVGNPSYFSVYVTVCRRKRTVGNLESTLNETSVDPTVCAGRDTAGSKGSDRPGAKAWPRIGSAGRADRSPGCLDAQRRA